MSKRAAKRADKKLKARQTIFDQRHARTPGFTRPGSLNPKKQTAR